MLEVKIEQKGDNVFCIKNKAGEYLKKRDINSKFAVAQFGEEADAQKYKSYGEAREDADFLNFQVVENF